MASNMTNLEDLEEFVDSPEEFQGKVQVVAKMIRNAKRVVFFTGAGISTSARIPDYRGPDGVWTRQAQGKAPPKSVAFEAAVPTPCHMAILAIQEYVAQSGRQCHVVSQNVDGLHRRSGVSRRGISELHGNSFKAVCWQCDFEKLYDKPVHSGRNGNGRCAACLQKVPHFCHCTYEECPECGATLRDSIIHFKENLPEAAIRRAMVEGRSADLCIVLGSSLQVSPANRVPKMVAERGEELVICNLQRTPLDNAAGVRLFARTDDMMLAVLRELGLEAKGPPRLSAPPAAVALPSAGGARKEGGPLTAEEDQGGYVMPIFDCPHAARIGPSPSVDRSLAALSAGCEECGDNSENWMCGTCQKVLCGRYVGQHMQTHHGEKQHDVCISLRDLNAWCYACDGYIVADDVNILYIPLHVAKFGYLPPGCESL